MLKLLKYEWKACARTCLPLYGVVLLVALINRLLYSDAVSGLLFGIPAFLTTLLYGALLVALFVMTMVILVQRFYKNLLGTEGYLMFTLPVSVSQHILSKGIIAVAMSALSCVAAFISIDLLSHDMSVGHGFVSLLRNLSAHPSDIAVTLEGVLWFALTALAGVLFIYLCIALGHLAKKHRLLMSFVWYFVLSTAVQVLGVIVMMGSVNEKTAAGAYSVLAFLDGMGAAGIHFIMLVLCLVSAAAGAVCFAGTRYILVHKLNLE